MVSRKTLGFPCAILVVLCSAHAAYAGQAHFTKAPTASEAPEGVRIEFAVNQATDVAVAVLDATGRVVRHLAAGVLGPNAPEPLKKDSLSQSLVWDGKDDRGRPVPAGRHAVRVGLGLSAEFDRVIGYNPRTVGEIKALTVDAAGNLYCLNGYGVPALAVFGRGGKYLRTILPHSPDLPAPRLAGVKTLTRADGVAVPFFLGARGPYDGVLGDVGIGPLRTWGSMAVTRSGTVLIAGPGGPKRREAHRLLVLGADGSTPGRGSRAGAGDTALRGHFRPDEVPPIMPCASTPESLLGPAVMPKGSGGVKGLALSPDETFVYAAGLGPKGRPAVYRTAWGEKPGTPEPFPTAAPAQPALLKDPWGIATDAKGRLYVCDRGSDRVAVFSAEGTFLADVKAPSPLRVAVHSKTGAIYVVSKQEVRKVSGFADARTVWTLPLPRVPGGTPPVFALDAGGDRPVLWIGSPQQVDWVKYVLWRVEDHGDAPGQPEEFSDRARQGLYSPVHLAVDPTRDEVYVREWRGSWRGQGFIRYDGKTGRRTKLKVRGNEMAVGPDSTLYVRSFRGAEAGSWIQRYDHSGRLLPFPGASDIVMGQKGFWVDGSLRGGTAVGVRGFCVAPNGDIYIVRYYSCRGGNRRAMAKKGYTFPKPWPSTAEALRPLVDVYSPDGRLKRAGVIAYFKQGACGIRVDRAGNIYVADNIKRPDEFYPAEIADQIPKPGTRELWISGGRPNFYLFNYGTLFKFPPAGGSIRPAKAGDPGAYVAGGAYRWRYVTVKGALWQHLGISPVPADTGRGHSVPYGCVCVNGRFDLDGFGRLFVPDVLQFAVEVLDANGNRITRFGRYGNADSRGPEITFNWGSFVGCAERAVYVADNLNRRIVRVELAYAAEETCRVP